MAERLSAIHVAGVATAVGVGLLVYSQTLAFAWDEGFHLLAAQLVKAGRTLYLDFCFPQTPLNAYWNAGWMWVLGESWRAMHAVAALCALAAVCLAAGFAWSRFPVSDWRLAAAVMAVALIGMNPLVVQFGTIGQPYALCLVLLVASFRAAVCAVERERALEAGLAGLAAGAAAASSLLAVTAGPVLLVWIVAYNRAGRRWRKAAAVAAGGTAAFVPLAWLLARDPRAVFFNVVQYHLLYRQVAWEDAMRHDVGTLSDWLDSAPALLLALLALAGLWFVRDRSGWERARRAEFYLCAWLAAAAVAYFSLAVHPVFPAYFVLAVPFLGILATAGLHSLAPQKPWRLLMALIFLVALGLGRQISGDDYTWRMLETIAHKVDAVTPRGAPILADPQVYFLTRRRPPSGMEHSDSHKLDFPAARAVVLHLASEAEVVRRIEAGAFAAVESCSDYKSFEDSAARRYAHSEEIEDCHLYWGRNSAPGIGLQQ